MAKGTTKVGYRNPNGQVVQRPTGLPGTDHNQKIYALRCEHCEEIYGANGSDIHLRRCPKCGGGRAGLSLGNEDRPAGKPATEWAVADAKARLSELLEKAAEGPLTITRNGKPVAVVVGIEEWKRKNQRRGTLSQFFQSAPEGFADLDLVRLKDTSRDIDL